MKKNLYRTPDIEFISLKTNEDILSGSFENVNDSHQSDYGVMFPF